MGKYSERKACIRRETEMNRGRKEQKGREKVRRETQESTVRGIHKYTDKQR